MMVKKILVGIAVIVLAILAFGIYKLLTFNLFDNKLSLVDQVPVSSKGYLVKIYSFPPSATVQGSIQVHLEYSNGNDVLLKNYNGYDKLIMEELQSDTMLMIGLQDTITNNFKRRSRFPVNFT